MYVKILFLIFVILLTIICLALHFSIMSDLKEITEDLNNFYNDFSEDMQVLAETLQVYHELLDGYQIPLIQLPEKKKETERYEDW